MNKRKYILTISLLCVMVIILTGASFRKTIFDGLGIYKNSSDAVFYVRALDDKGELKSSGSGFCISKDGLALTASHVIRDCTSFNAVLPNGEELKNLTVVKRDDLTDVAVIRLPKRKAAYTYAELSADTAQAGEKIYAIGYPLKTTKIISDGIVANVETLINGIPRLLVTSDFANGMSGGPVISESGKVVGICSATLRTMNGISSSPTINQINEALVVEKTQ